VTACHALIQAYSLYQNLGGSTAILLRITSASNSGEARGLMIGVHGGAPAAKILDLGVAREIKNGYFYKGLQFSRCPVHPQGRTWIRPCFQMLCILEG
jgi:hypothetical protein